VGVKPREGRLVLRYRGRTGAWAQNARHMGPHRGRALSGHGQIKLRRGREGGRKILEATHPVVRVLHALVVLLHTARAAVLTHPPVPPPPHQRWRRRCVSPPDPSAAAAARGYAERLPGACVVLVRASSRDSGSVGGELVPGTSRDRLGSAGGWGIRRGW
jgi:hypothetical protein